MVACFRSINGSDFNHVEVYITLKGYVGDRWQEIN